MATRKFTGRIGQTISDTQFRFETIDSPSKGKPNVVYIVLDDTGFAQLGCYGSTINTPNINRLAYEGLRYNNFHTTAICSATRASLLTGANHHSVGIQTVAETVTGLSNATGTINPEFATLAEILQSYDYRTMAIGKWHLNAFDARTAAGPYKDWPLGKGFDTYYGFLAADMDQWNPTLTRDNTMVEQPKAAKDGYHLSEDLAENAVHYIFDHHLTYPEQPFFLYLAFGAMHTPHHAPKEYIDKYRGKFDKGWDAIREEWFENQKRLGVIPQDAKLTERNPYVAAWDTLSDDQKKAYARYMEVFAGFLEHTDAQIGKVIDYIDSIGQLDNTIVVLISDNGASSEGGKDGHFNLNVSMDVTDSYPRDVELALEHYDTLGDEYSNPHYPTGWANAGNTPFQWYKQWTFEGGTHDPLIIRYPGAIDDPGSVRTQFNHVSDITPTVLDLIGFEKPKYIKGVHQREFEGKSFISTIKDKDAAETKTVQHFEIFGSRSIYKDGWKAVVNHMFNKSYDEDVWELYHVEEDYSESEDVADKYPEKLKELQEEWLIQATRYNVFPMLKGGLLAKKDSLREYTKDIYRPAKTLVFENVIYPYVISEEPEIGARDSVITFNINRKDSDGDGVLFAKGDRFAGISIYIKDGKLKYVYNLDADTFYIAEAKDKLPEGEVEIKVAFIVTEGQNADVSLYVNKELVAETKVKDFYYTIGCGAETAIRKNPHTSVYEKDYQSPFIYNGEIKKVTIEVPETTTSALEILEKELLHD